jgi:hypothetical protein
MYTGRLIARQVNITARGNTNYNCHAIDPLKSMILKPRDHRTSCLIRHAMQRLKDINSLLWLGYSNGMSLELSIVKRTKLGTRAILYVLGVY